MKWVCFAESDMTCAFYCVALPAMGYMSKVDHSDKKTLNAFKAMLDGLESSIKAKKTKFLVCDNVTLADISVAAITEFLYKFLFTKEVAAKYHNIDSWYKSYLSDPTVSSVLTEGYCVSSQKLPDEFTSVLLG